MTRATCVVGLLVLVLAHASAAPSDVPPPNHVSFDYKEKPAREVWQDFAEKLGYTLEIGEDANGDQLITARAANVEPWVAAKLIGCSMDDYLLVHESNQVVEVFQERSGSRHLIHQAVTFSDGHRVAETNLRKLYGQEDGSIEREKYLERVGDFLLWDLGLEETRTDVAACSIEAGLFDAEVECGQEFSRLLAEPAGGRSDRLEAGERAWSKLGQTMIEFEPRIWTVEEFAAALALSSGIPVVLLNTGGAKPIDLSEAAVTAQAVSATTALERALPMFQCKCAALGSHLLIYGEDWDPPLFFEQGYAVYELLPTIEGLIGGPASEASRWRGARWHGQIEEQLYILRLGDCWLGTRVAVAGSPADQDAVQWVLSQYSTPTYSNFAREPDTELSLKLVNVDLAGAVRALAEKLGYEVWLSREAQYALPFDLTVEGAPPATIARLLSDEAGISVTIDHEDRCVFVGTTEGAFQAMAPMDDRLTLDTRTIAKRFRDSGLAAPDYGDADDRWTEADKIGFHVFYAMWDAIGRNFRSEGATVADRHFFLSGPESETMAFAELRDLLGVDGNGASVSLGQQRAVWDRLRDKRLTLDLKEQSVADTIEWLRAELMENVFIGRGARENCAGTKLSLCTAEGSAVSGLDAICQAAGLCWGLAGNVLVFDAEPDGLFCASNGFAVYDVSPLLKGFEGEEAPLDRAALVSGLVAELKSVEPRRVENAVSCGAKIIVTGDMRAQEAAVAFLKTKGWQEK